MATVEFSAQVGKTFSFQAYEAISIGAVGTPASAVEISPGRYRASVALTGIVYGVASAPNLTVSGYANLSYPGFNGASELLDTYEDALALGSSPIPPEPTDLQPENVRAGVTYLDSNSVVQTGTLELPLEDQVLADVGYGAEGTEFLGTLPSVSQQGSTVASTGQIKSPLFIGTDYRTEYGNGFLWRVKAPLGLDIDDVEVHFRGRLPCSNTSSYAWDSLAVSVQEVTIDSETYWDIAADLLGSQTTGLSESEYYWFVVVETISGEIVVAQYNPASPLLLLKS